MSEDVLVPDEYIIDFSLTKEEREKKGKEYEDACNEAFKKLGLLEDKKEKINMLSDFYKKNKNDKIWWIDDLDSIGKHMFSFDKVKIFNLFSPYSFSFELLLQAIKKSDIFILIIKIAFAFHNFFIIFKKLI